MNKKAPTNTRDYLEAGREWETDEIVRARKSESRAWMVAIVGVVVGVLGVVAVTLMLPLKTVEPFVVRVDKNTGATDIVTVLDQHKISYNTAIDRYFLAQYVRYCEAYSWDNANTNYEACAALSSPTVAKEVFQSIRPSNPSSPASKYGKNGIVRISVNSIAFLAPGTAQVRYTQSVLAGTGSIDSQWIATIVYQYLNVPEDQRTRLVNPVGFSATQFQIDPVTVPSTQVAVQTPPASRANGGAR